MNKIINKIIFDVGIDSKQVVKSIYVITEKVCTLIEKECILANFITIGQPVFTLIMKIRL